MRTGTWILLGAGQNLKEMAGAPRVTTFAFAVVGLWTSVVGAAQIPSTNSRGAASCAELFRHAGDLEEAAFFGSFAEGPEWTFATALLQARRGEPVYTLVQRAVKSHAERAEAARVLLLAAADMLSSGHALKRSGAAMNVRTALELDPALRPAAETWVVSLTRAEITPRNSFDLLQFLASVVPPPTVAPDRRTVEHTASPRVAELQLGIAQRALETGRPALAAFAAVQGYPYEDKTGPLFGNVLIAAAQKLSPKQPALANTAILYAFLARPELRFDEDARWLHQSTASCGRKELIEQHLRTFPQGRFTGEAQRLLKETLPDCILSAGCGSGPSPFYYAIESTSDELFFPGASYSQPLPARLRPRDFSERARTCRAFDPSLFPDPFDRSWRLVTIEGETFLSYQVIEALSEAADDRCVEESTYEMEIGRDGKVTGARVVQARFANGPENDPSAASHEEAMLLPILLKAHLGPAKIRGTPVRSKLRAGMQRNCTP